MTVPQSFTSAPTDDISDDDKFIGGAEVPRDMDTKNNKAPWWAAVVLGGLLTGNLMILGWLANSLSSFNTAISNLDVAVGQLKIEYRDLDRSVNRMIAGPGNNP